MIGDLMNILFRSGVPYDAEKHTFNVRPEHIPLIQQQYEQVAEEEFFSLSKTTRPIRGWDDFDF